MGARWEASAVLGLLGVPVVLALLSLAPSCSDDGDPCPKGFAYCVDAGIMSCNFNGGYDLVACSDAAPFCQIVANENDSLCATTSTPIAACETRNALCIDGGLGTCTYDYVTSVTPCEGVCVTTGAGGECALSSEPDPQCGDAAFYCAADGSMELCAYGYVTGHGSLGCSVLPGESDAGPEGSALDGADEHS